ncbi:SAP30-binding protein [Galendromus occidentalis]|uniref:SAP30-binding protein n=1 Tax=Galendromus occidentalis TaxID=34638 RepID=A0AAJ6VXS2_9ACAR|nr:SAP30-binding protein [Galendromus occidentalis]
MSGLASLTAHYTDSDDDESPPSVSHGARHALERDMRRALKAPPVAQHRSRNHNRVEITPNGSTGPLVAYDGPDSDGDHSDVKKYDASDEEAHPDLVTEPMDIEKDRIPPVGAAQPRPHSPRTHHRLLRDRGPPVQLPPEPTTRCNDELQKRISELYNRSKIGDDHLERIQRKKTFRNPSIYEKLLVHCDVDELGSNFPSEVFDPHAFRKEDYYDELSRRQTEAMHRLEKERKKPDQSSSTKTAIKKSKWDQGGLAASNTRGVAAPGLVTMPTGAKPVVISRLGSLPKPKNHVTHVGTSIASRR